MSSSSLLRGAIEVWGILSSDDSYQDEIHSILRDKGSNSIIDKIRDISSDTYHGPRNKLPTLDLDQPLETSRSSAHLFNSPFNTKASSSSSSVSLISDSEREIRTTNLTAANVLAQFSDIEETIWPDGNPDINKTILKLGCFPNIEQ